MPRFLIYTKSSNKAPAVKNELQAKDGMQAISTFALVEHLNNRNPYLVCAFSNTKGVEFVRELGVSAREFLNSYEKQECKDVRDKSVRKAIG